MLPAFCRDASVLGAVDMRGFVERERAVADHSPAVARGVSRVAQVEQLRREAAPARGEGEPVDRRAAACLLVRDIGAQIDNRLRGRAVGCLRLAVSEVMRKVGTHHDQRFRAAPQCIEYLCNLVRGGFAHRQRHHGELPEHRLQERQVHLQRMLERVRRRVHADLWQR